MMAFGSLLVYPRLMRATARNLLMLVHRIFYLWLMSVTNKRYVNGNTAPIIPLSVPQAVHQYEASQREGRLEKGFGPQPQLAGADRRLFPRCFGGKQGLQLPEIQGYKQPFDPPCLRCNQHYNQFSLTFSFARALAPVSLFTVPIFVHSLTNSPVTTCGGWSVP